MRKLKLRRYVVEDYDLQAELFASPDPTSYEIITEIEVTLAEYAQVLLANAAYYQSLYFTEQLKANHEKQSS